MLHEQHGECDQAARGGASEGALSAKDLVTKVKKDHVLLWKN
jgi:hypothetical protein